MKKIIYSLLFIALIGSVKKVSAATEVITMKANGCVVTGGSGSPIYHYQWGIKATGGSVVLGCYFQLTRRAYSSIKVTAGGYQRTTAGLSGFVSSTDRLGTNYVATTIGFPQVQSAGQVVSATVNLNSSFINPNQYMSSEWTIWEGENYLTGLEVTATY